MKRHLPGLFLTTTLFAATDLAPIREVQDLEGVKIELVRFQSPNGSITYDPPWPMRGSGDEGAFILPPQFNHARGGIRIHRKTKLEELPIGDNAQLREWLLKKLPRDADKLVVTSVKTDGVKMNQQATIAVFYNYSLIGDPVSCVSFLAWREKDGAELFEFVLECSPDDFDKLFKPLETSLYSIAGF